jgi:hypothetical protein
MAALTPLDTITLRIHVAWWFKYYLQGVILMCQLTGCEPNMKRISYWIDKAISIKVAK